MKKIELLAPAGTFEAVKAAVFNGADAIYCGGIQFGARAYAGNFTRDQIKEVVSFCHQRNVSVYVTMNTLIFEDEMEKAMEEVDFYYREDVDALIVQDIGLMDRIRKQYPDFELHASTQMHIHNLSGVKWLKKMGVKRVVLARETPLEVVKECSNQGVDIEIFSYGALCISYSGQCLMSHFLNQRSGNRGMCAQCCRMSYSLLDDQQQKLSSKEDYLLSPKDLNTIEKIPMIIESGVSSLKIEGRMKRPEYVGLIVKTYREAIDHYYESKQYTISKKRMDDLKVMFNRGFTEGFLFSNGANLMNSYRPNHVGIPIGKVSSVKNGVIEITIDQIVNQGDGLRILSQYGDIGLVTEKLEVNGKWVAQATSNQIITFYHKGKVSVNDVVVKTTDIQLIKQFQKNQNEYKRFPLKLQYQIELEKPIVIIVSDDDGHCVKVEGKMLCQSAKTSPISKERFYEIFSKLGDSIYTVSDFSGEFIDFFLPIKELNEIRREIVQQMNQKREKRHLSRESKKEYLPLKIKLCERDIQAIEVFDEKQLSSFNGIENIVFFSQNKILQKNDVVFPCNPVVNEKSEYKKGEYLLCNELGNLDAIEGNGYVIASSHLNVCNSYSLQCLYEQGIHQVILSHEVDEFQKNEIFNQFLRFNQQKPVLMDYKFGQRVLMVMKHCPIHRQFYDGTSEHCSRCKTKNFWLQGKKGDLFQFYGDDQCIQHLVEDKPFIQKESFVSSQWYRCFKDQEESVKMLLNSIKKNVNSSKISPFIKGLFLI